MNDNFEKKKWKKNTKKIKNNDNNEGVCFWIGFYWQITERDLTEVHPRRRLHVLVLKETKSEVSWPQPHYDRNSVRTVQSSQLIKYSTNRGGDWLGPGLDVAEGLTRKSCEDLW